MKLKFAILLLVLLVFTIDIFGREVDKTILITNAKIFDGTDKLVEGKDVLIQGNKITKIAKGKMVGDGLDSMFKLAKKYKLKIVFGTDVVVNPAAAADQNREFVERAKWFSPTEILNQATANSGELLQLSGDRSPYPGKIGVLQEGAYADLLLINANPLEDIGVLSDPENNLGLIMKDGKIFKTS